MDGANATFSLAGRPNPAASLQLFRNGILQQAGVDYSLSGNAITMLANSIPTTGDTLQSWYRTSGIATGAIQFSDAEVPSGTVDGSNGTYSLGAAPNPVASLQVFRNGILQKLGSDYSLTDSTITFVGTSIPQTGDTLQASYRY